jgi:hypothetical protein
MSNYSKNAGPARPWSHARKITATMPDGSQIILKNTTGPTTRTNLTQDEVIATAKTFDLDYGDQINPPAGFARQSFAPEGAPDYERMTELNHDAHLYKGQSVERHGVLIDQLWEPGTGIHYQINSAGSQQLTRSQLSEIMGMICGAFLWEEDNR